MVIKKKLERLQLEHFIQCSESESNIFEVFIKIKFAFNKVRYFNIIYRKYKKNIF